MNRPQSFARAVTPSSALAVLFQLAITPSGTGSGLPCTEAAHLTTVVLAICEGPKKWKPPLLILVSLSSVAANGTHMDKIIRELPTAYAATCSCHFWSDPHGAQSFCTQSGRRMTPRPPMVSPDGITNTSRPLISFCQPACLAYTLMSALSLFSRFLRCIQGYLPVSTWNPL